MQVQIERQRINSVLAAPLMDVDHIVDTSILLSPVPSSTWLPPASVTSTDAISVAPGVLGPSTDGPPTARLIALGPTRPSMVPDLPTLFSLYYDDPTKPPEPKVEPVS